MGIFSSGNCICCNKVIGLVKHKTLDGFICSDCKSKCEEEDFLRLKTMSLENVNKSIEKKMINETKLKEFNTTKKIGTFLHVDLEKKQFIIPGAFGSIKNCKVYNFEDVVEVEILEDGDSVIKSNGLGRAVVGGLVFGVAGAVIGGVTGSKKAKTIVNSLKIKITLNDMMNPVKYINIITDKTKSDSFLYKVFNENAQEILSLLTLAKSDGN